MANRIHETAFIHETALVDDGAEIGAGSKIWHWVHVCSSAKIGARCSLGQNVYVDRDVVLKDGVRVQNNVSIYSGVELEEDVFLGPSCVFTNVFQPRAHVSTPREKFLTTPVGRGASIGANATIVCGNSIGEYAFIGAGSVVTKDVPAHALLMGNPARQKGWMCACGEKLAHVDEEGEKTCERCGATYRLKDGRCVKAVA